MFNTNPKISKPITQINSQNFKKDKFLTVNLSNYQLTNSDYTLLEKGLTFIPTPKTLPVSNIIQNKDRLIRNVKLKSFFHSKIHL